MTFHPRKVLAHLSVDSIKRQLELAEPDLAREVDWGLVEAGQLEALEKKLLDAGGRLAEFITALQSLELMASELGDRAMIAACGSDLDLRRGSCPLAWCSWR